MSEGVSLHFVNKMDKATQLHCFKILEESNWVGAPPRQCEGQRRGREFHFIEGRSNLLYKSIIYKKEQVCQDIAVHDYELFDGLESCLALLLKGLGNRHLLVNTVKLQRNCLNTALDYKRNRNYASIMG